MSYYGNNQRSDRYIQIIKNLSKKTDEQAKKIHEQAGKIDDLEKKFEGLHNVVYQLVGGLYNHEKQAGTITDHLSFLFSEDEEDEVEILNKPGGWGIMPTTRQGDSLETKIGVLETEIIKISDALNKKQQPNESDDISESSCSSISKKRINSNYLCGNE